MRTLLIAEASKIICEELCEHFSNQWNIQLCHNASDAIDALHILRPDALILSLDLPGSDGLSVLSSVFPHLPATIVGISSTANRFMANFAGSWGVNYLFEYPIDTAKLKLALDIAVGQQIPAKLSARHLRALGVRPGLDGAWCVIAAIPYLLQDPTRKLGKDVYTYVADVCGMTDFRDVDRAIRFMIDSSWKSRDISTWSNYFPLNAAGDIDRPKSKDFIRCILQKVQ